METVFGKNSFMAVLVIFVAFHGGLFAEEPNNLRQKAQTAFEQLTQNSLQALRIAEQNPNKKKYPAKDIMDQFNIDNDDFKFNIDSVPIPNDNPEENIPTANITAVSDQNFNHQRSDLAIKVWFELEDGTLINPTRHRWNPNEKFYIHVEAAVPIYVSLFQNYLDNRPTSRQVYPDKKYENSFKVLQPGESTKLPVVFAVDNDMRDEMMSMVVVRADWKNIQEDLNVPAVNSVQDQRVESVVNIAGTGTMKCVNERIMIKENLKRKDVESLCGVELTQTRAESLAKVINEDAKGAKFQIIDFSKATSNIPNDVCFFMFGAGYIGQWQLTIKK